VDDQRAAVGGGQHVVRHHRVAAHPLDALALALALAYALVLAHRRRRQLARHRADIPAGGGQLARHLAADAAVRAQYQCSALMCHVCLRG
jgi:hypothetical protein